MMRKPWVKLITADCVAKFPHGTVRTGRGHTLVFKEGNFVNIHSGKASLQQCYTFHSQNRLLTWNQYVTLASGKATWLSSE